MPRENTSETTGTMRIPGGHFTTSQVIRFALVRDHGLPAPFPLVGMPEDAKPFA